MKKKQYQKPELKIVPEIWKVWKDTRYNSKGALWEVSNYGNVKKNGEIFKCGINPTSHYKQISNSYVHRVVAELFIPNPENKPEVDHIDTNTLNNKIDNLQWVTPKENMQNPLTKQHMKDNQTDVSGENNPFYGKHHTEHVKKKQSEMMKGNKIFLGKHHSEATKQHLSEQKRGKHRVYHEDGTWHMTK